MLYYVTFGTNDLVAAKRFYTPTLATLGITDLAPDSDEGCYGPPGGEAQLYVGPPYDQTPATRGNGSMIAFTAPDRQAVQAFHAAALAHGGTDEGAPGLRPYAPNFYACYVRDPDGNKLSAVCTKPE